MLAPAGKTVVVGLVIVTTGAVLTLITLIEICLAAVRPPLSTTVAMTTCVPADNTLAINAPVPSGPSILDVQVSRALTPQLQAAAGYAHIFPGAFLKETTPGASYSHPYVMLTYVFLAEK